MSVKTADFWHAVLMRVAALFTIGYWTEYFTSGNVRTSDDPAYVEFENAFPLADGYMAVCLLVSARLLRKERPGAVPAGIAAGSAMVYLAGMDILYNVQHGKYRKMNSEMGLETLINGFSLVFGPWTMIRLWRARKRLGA
jgi:hypothetical protein